MTQPTENTTKPLPLTSVYDVPCRKCGAGPGDGCWSLRRGTCEATMYPHAERRNDYRKARHG